MKRSLSFFLVFCIVFCAIAQERKNLNLGPNSNYSGFDGIKDQVAASTLIISGENGEFSGFTLRFEYKFLRYLNAEHGLRNYVMEVGPAKATLINEYISTGDSSVEILLRSVSSTKFMRLYKNVKRLNEELPDSLKIRVFGIDIEKYSALPIVQISNILPAGDIPERIRIGVEALHGAARFVIKKGLYDFNHENEGPDADDEHYFYNPTNFSVFKSSEEFLIYYDSLKTEFQKWSGADFPKLEEAVSWLRDNKEWRDHRYSAYQYSMREQRLYSNFIKVIEAHPGEKFFAQLNRCRISKKKLYGDCGYYDYSGIVQRLIQDGHESKYPFFTVAIFHATAGDINADNSANMEAISKELQPLFSTMNDETAQLLALDGDDPPVLRANYDAIVMEKNYPVRDFGETETDMMPMFSAKTLRKFVSPPPFLAINYIYSYHFFNTKIFKAALNKENLPLVDPRSYYGVDATAYLSSYMYLGLNYSWAATSSQHFVSQRYLANFGAQIYGNRHYYIGGGLQMGYMKHSYSKPATQFADSSYYRYNEPTVIGNPAFVMGLNYLMQVKIWYFSVYVNAGYMADLSDKRWLLKGEYVSEIGKFSNTGPYVSAGVGLALPLSKKDLSKMPEVTKR